MRAPLAALAAAVVLAVAGCEEERPKPAASSAAPSGSSASSARSTASATASASATPHASSSAPPDATGAASAASPASAATSASASAAPSAAAAAGAADSKRLEIQGKAIQGGLLRAKVDGKVKRIGFPGHKTTILEDGEFLIAFARTAPAKEKLTLTLEDGAVLEREFDVEQRTYETDRIDNLPKNQVELDAQTRKQVAKAEAKLDELRMKFSKVDCFRGPFAWPVKGKISSRYGQPRVLNGTDAGPHWGVDLVVPVGTPVRAPACGKVVFVEKDLPLSGSTLVLDHGRGLTSTFIHLDKFKAKVGDEVKAGEVIATVGLTGRTNGPHLDWRMNLYDIRTDPELLAH